MARPQTSILRILCEILATGAKKTDAFTGGIGGVPTYG